MQGRLMTVAAALALACATGPPGTPAAGKAVAWGYLTLVPPAGLETGSAGAYGDRRLRYAERVDYSTPGFAVVYLAAAEGGPRVARTHRPGGTQDVSLTVEIGSVGPRLVPRHAALGQGDRVTLRNRTEVVQLLSCPSTGVVERLAPGESVGWVFAEPGEHAVHLLGGAGDVATLFVAPGPFSTVSTAGRWVLDGLSPGAFDLRSWHPRQPPSSTRISLEPGEVLRHDLEVGVGLVGAGGASQESSHGQH
jgi:hypothetical protein